LTPAESDGLRVATTWWRTLHKVLEIREAGDSVSLIRRVIVGLHLLRPSAELEPVDALVTETVSATVNRLRAISSNCCDPFEPAPAIAPI